jgi:Alpha amylase, catalytic domain
MGNHDQKRIASRYGTDRVDSINMILSTLPGVSITYNVSIPIQCQMISNFSNIQNFQGRRNWYGGRLDIVERHN